MTNPDMPQPHEPPPALPINADSNTIKLYDLPGLILFGALAVIVILQFLTRYALNDSLAWTEEVARFLLLGVTFFGAVSLVARGEHIAVELIFRRVHASNAKILAISGASMGVAYYSLLAISAGALAAKTEQMLISVAIPKALIYASLAAAMAICAVFSIKRLVTLINATNAQIASVYLDQSPQGEQENG